MRRRFLGERFLPTILILLICVNVGINIGFAETEGKYRVELVLPTAGSVYPNERLTAQITTFLDKYKPPEPGQPPPPLSPEDWIYIGNVTVRFEVKDEAGNTVDLNIPQGLKTDDKGWLQISFNAPSREGKYTVTAYAVIEGVECSDSEPILVSKEERPPVPTPTPTPQPTKTLVFEAQHFYIALVIILSVAVVLAVVLAIRRRRKFLVASIAVLAIVVILAYGVQFAMPPTPTVPTQTPTPPTMPPYAPISIKSNASYGFDQTYPQEEHFVLSRGKSATLIIILTSTANRTLHLTPSAERLPTGVTAEFDSQFLALEPNKPVTVKLTVTVSSTAPETNRESAVLNFMLQEEGFRFKTNYYFFYLTIV